MSPCDSKVGKSEMTQFERFVCTSIANAECVTGAWFASTGHPWLGLPMLVQGSCGILIIVMEWFRKP